MLRDINKVLDCSNCIVKVIKKEDKIIDFKAKSKDIVLKANLSTQFIFCFIFCNATYLLKNIKGFLISSPRLKS